jgi:hypothetical protein
MEYDGWYQVSLELDPGARPAEVERLDLVIPLWSKADVMLAGRGEEIAQRIPAGEGVVWESRQFGHRPKGFRGTWIPVVYAGNGGRGLWFKGESDEGWVLDDAQSCVFFERDGGAVTLRFRFVNRPVVLRAKRTLTFALQTAPARPLQTLWRRLLWEYPEPSRLWFNTGWCCYGWGGDDFYLPSDDDYRELGRWLLHPESFDTTPPQRHITRMRMDWLKEGRDPAKLPIVLYSSHYVISASHPALETYRGEWAGKNTLAPNRDYFMNQTVLNKGTDFTGRFLWDTPEKCSELAPEWNQRLIECYLWYYRKLAELSGNNGTFWDNAAVFRFTAETPQGVAAQAPEHLFGSVYRGKGKALVWLVNTSEKDQVSDVWLEETALLGKRAARLRDLETGEDMARLPKQAGDARRDATWAHVWVRPHDFRALVLE